jgi:hypothetical protein
LIEELNAELLEAKGGHPTNDRFQVVSANTSEPKPPKVGKYDACHDWYVLELPLHIAARNRE